MANSPGAVTFYQFSNFIDIILSWKEIVSTRLCYVFFLIASFASFGCSSGVSDQQRLEVAFGGPLKTVVPVGGTVLINGKPESDVFVYLHKVDSSGPVVVRPPHTDEDGNFQFTTYILGDGIEPGKYKLTFQWLTIERTKKEGSRVSGVDRLNKLFSDPKKSEYTIEVEEGIPQTDLEFNLITSK